ncbi:MAG: hypothetical protein HQM04_15715 [Magnetococcales bacterium]|nr:hypothetical protein [Magnetococcales bacterium]MBF0116475.1 hypothetical protein [Magnetococcales bacterium]
MIGNIIIDVKLARTFASNFFDSLYNTDISSSRADSEFWRQAEESAIILKNRGRLSEELISRISYGFYGTIKSCFKPIHCEKKRNGAMVTQYGIYLHSIRTSREANNRVLGFTSFCITVGKREIDIILRELPVNLTFHLVERFSLRENIGGNRLDTALKHNLLELSKKIIFILPTFKNKTFPITLPFGDGLILGAVNGGNNISFGYRRTYTNRFADYNAEIDDYIFRKKNHPQSGVKFITYIDYSSCAPEQDSIAEWERNFFLIHSDFINSYWCDSLFTKRGFDFRSHLHKYESIVRDFVSHANHKDYYNVIQRYGARALGMVEIKRE